MSEQEQIPSALRALYAEDLAAPVGGADERARIRTRVLATLGVATAAGAAEAASAQVASTAGEAAVTVEVAGSAGATSAAVIAGKLVVLAVVLGGVLGGGYWLTGLRGGGPSGGGPPGAPSAVATAPHRAPAAAPVPVGASEAPIARSPEVPPTVPLGHRSPARLAAQLPRPPLAASPPRGSSPASSGAGERGRPRAPGESLAAAGPATNAADELRLLAQARGALQRGATSIALQLLEQDLAARPQSCYEEERAALLVESLWRLGRRREAAARRRDFAERYPDSIHRSRVTTFLEEEQ